MSMDDLGFWWKVWFAICALGSVATTVALIFLVVAGIHYLNSH